MSKKPEVEPADGPIGRIEFDELGNAVWTPFTTVRTEATLNRILKNDKLSISDDDASDPICHVKAGEGYNPYRSGIVDREKEVRPKKKDLRALSEWVKLKKRLQTGG